MTTDPIKSPIPDHGIELPEQGEALVIEFRTEPKFLTRVDEPFIVDQAFGSKSIRTGTQFDHYKILGKPESVADQHTRGAEEIRIHTGDRGMSLGTGRIAAIRSQDSDWAVVV